MINNTTITPRNDSLILHFFQLSEEDSFALSIITYIGCGVSTGALIITLIVFLSIE